LDLLAQAVGGAAAALGISAWQLRRDAHLILALAGTAGLWCLHFLLMGALTAAAVNAVTILRNVLAVAWPRPALGYAFIGAYLAAGVMTWRSPWDLLPTLAVCLGAASVFLAGGLTRRAGLLAGALLWLVFNAHAGSIPGMLIMAAESLSNGVFIVRSLRRRRYAAERRPPPW